jgi:hypothetical protein
MSGGDDIRGRGQSASSPREPFNIRVAWQCEPGVTREQAEVMAREIQRWAEGFAAVSHCFELEVYDVLDDEDSHAH